MKNKIFKIAVTGVLSALSVVLVMFIHFPIFPVISFIEYDPADIPIFIVTNMCGCGYGLTMTAVVSLVQGLTVSASSGLPGIFMHFVSTGMFVVAQSIVNHLIRKKLPRSYDFIGTLVGAVTHTIAMCLMNLLITPRFMGVPVSAVLDLMGFILSFNLIKAFANGFAALFIYRILKRPLSAFFPE